MQKLQNTTERSSAMIDLYRMHLRFVYGDVTRLITELKDTIDIYKQSPNADSEGCKKRICYYESIIKIAQNDST